MPLTINELEDLRNRIRDMQPGIYILKEIVGHQWSELQAPTVFGRLFKEHVAGGDFPSIAIEGKKSNNHVIYRVS